MAKRATKLARILQTLLRRSLNRFEAELVGDHCLHSTVSSLRHSYALTVESHWEQVPNNHSDQLTSVKRYFIPEKGRNKAKQLLKLWGLL